MSRSLQSSLTALTVEDMWRTYAAERLPPQEIATSYSLEQVREAFNSAAWAVLTIEHRTRRRARNALFLRWRRETSSLLQRVFAQF